MNFFYIKEFEIGYVLILTRYRLTDIIKPTKFYLLYITVYMHLIFHRSKKNFSIIETKLRHCIILQKNIEKTTLLYITVTVSRGIYLGIDQSMKRKFVSSAANRRKIRMFDTDFVICLCFVFAFSCLVQFHYHSRDNNVS